MLQRSAPLLVQLAPALAAWSAFEAVTWQLVLPIRCFAPRSPAERLLALVENVAQASCTHAAHVTLLLMGMAWIAALLPRTRRGWARAVALVCAASAPAFVLLLGAVAGLMLQV